MMRGAGPGGRGNAFAQDQLQGAEPADHFAQATEGSGSPVPYRDEMESAFGTDFGGVSAYLGGPAAKEGLGGLGAQAAAHGSSVAFGDANPSKSLVAHELAHVVQQQGGGGGVQRKPTGVSSAGGAEQRADAAAAAVTSGRPVPDVGGAAAGDIHLAVDTNGGSWDTSSYTATNTGAGVGKGVGAHISLEFTPADPVLADHIGLTQTVKTLHSSAPGGPVDQTSFPAGNKANFGLDGVSPGESDKGRAIDQGDGADPNTSPLYAVEDGPGRDAGALTDGPTDPGFGQHGHRKAKPGGGFDVKDAKLDDTPNRSLAFVGEEWTQTFEAAALVLDGPLKDAYLGTVEWGWKVDAAGVCTLNPTPIRMVSPGAPTSDFMDAATKWNNHTLLDSTGGAHATVDLPITSVSSGAQAASAMSTADIIARIPVVDTEIAALAAGADKTNKQFEKLALETELGKRKAQVDVKVNSTEDWTGADEAYVQLTGSGGSKSSSEVSLNDGDSHSFDIELATILPIRGPITVKVFDGDWPDGDDELVNMAWASPYAAASNSSTADGASYDVTVQFKR